MKKIIVYAIVLVTVITSACKKDKVLFQSYLKGKMNGVAFECNANISANKPEPIPGQGSDPTIRIWGEWPMHSIKLFITGEGVSLRAGSYVFEGGKNRSATILENNVDAYYAGDSGFGDPIPLYGSGRITILEISKNYIKGSFEFVTTTYGITGMPKTVTDGEFYIKRN